MGHIRDRWKDPARKGKGQRWQVKYRVDGRERDGGSFDNREVAKRKLVELEAAVQRGAWVDPNSTTTVVELLRAHAATRIHRPGTAGRVASLIRNHVEPTQLGSRRAAAVRPSEAQAWVTGRARLLAPSTLRKLVTLMRGAFAAALLDHTVARNPFSRVSVPRDERERIVPLTVAQVAAVADAIRVRYRAMVIAQAGLGLRLGELLALRVQDVDFLRRTVRVEDQIDRATRERVDPKTPRSRRTLPLPAIVAEELSRHIAAHPPAADGLLFHTASGRPLPRTTYPDAAIRDAIAAVNRAADEVVAADTSARPVRVPVDTSSHDLRHHFASLLLASGQSVIAVAELLGHENATLVLTTYGHLMPGGDDLARRAIEAAWTAAPDGSDRAAAAQGRPE